MVQVGNNIKVTRHGRYYKSINYLKVTKVKRSILGTGYNIMLEDIATLEIYKAKYIDGNFQRVIKLCD